MARISPAEWKLHEKAFTTNRGDPSYRELETLRYRDGAAAREMLIPKGDVFHQFRTDVEKGQLPSVSWLVAPENFSDHPSAPWYGAWYVAEALDILTRNPELWKKTIFVLTYDENDGYFDHVPPFVAPDPDNPESGKTSPGLGAEMEYLTPGAGSSARKRRKQARGGPIGLGYRVPLIVASPWSRGGYVCSQVFDHTSVLQLLEKIASRRAGKEIRETNISGWRRAVCGDLSAAFRPFDEGTANRLPFPPKSEFLEGVHKAQFKHHAIGLWQIIRAATGTGCPALRPRCPTSFSPTERSAPMARDLRSRSKRGRRALPFTHTRRVSSASRRGYERALTRLRRPDD